jgi:hypothetical protein
MNGDTSMKLYGCLLAALVLAPAALTAAEPPRPNVLVIRPRCQSQAAFRGGGPCRQMQGPTGAVPVASAVAARGIPRTAQGCQVAESAV